MASENTVTLVGSMGRDWDLRYTTGGKAVANTGLAVNRRYQVNGEWTEVTSWFNLVCWGDLGEHFAASTSKGDRIIVTGRLEQRTYEDREGVSKNVVEVVVDDGGPSLRWAEATVERITRSDHSTGGKPSEPLPEEEPF
jgi:single-strand DNA-binding protein